MLSEEGREFGWRRFAAVLVVLALILPALVVSAATRSAPFASVPLTEKPVTFRSGRDTLFGILSIPAGGGRHAAVVLLSGSERGGVGAPSLVDHARVLAFDGYAVLRYDPPGVGRSTGDHRLETLDDRTREATAAVDYLRSRPEIRPDEIGLWGVSQGGWVTQMAAAASRKVAFIVSVSGSGVSVAEQQVYSVEAQSRAAGFHKLDIAKAGLFARLLVDWHLSRPLYREQNRARLRRLGPGPWSTFATLVYTPGSLTPSESLRRGIAILESIEREPWARYLYLDTALLPALEAIPPGKVRAARAAMERNFLLKPEKYLRAVRCPVLAMWGEDDTAVPARKSAALYRRYLEAAGNHDITIVVFANADHSINGFNYPYWKTLNRWLRHRYAP
jgi:pimeloyl-ACP methyl ester carboxylesterase